MIGIRRLALQEEIIQRLGVGSRGKLFSLRGCQLRDSVPTFRSTHDAPQRGNFLQQPGDDAVGSNHKIFNQFRGAILLLLHNTNDLLVKH